MNNNKALIAYILGWFTGVIILIISGQDKYTKFHAWQSILFSISAGIIGWIISGISVLLSWFTFGIVLIIPFAYWALIFIIWIMLMIKAYKGEKYKLILIGNLAERLS